MEDVLHLYMRPYDPNYPVVCIDELPCLLRSDTIVPLPMHPLCLHSVRHFSFVN